MRVGLLRKPFFEKLKVLGVYAFLVAVGFFARPVPWLFLVGGVFVVAGEFIRLWAAGYLQRDKRLTTSGPYAHCRNPLYLGRMFLVIGFCLAANLWWVLPLPLAVFFFLYMPRKERREGGRLRELFGEEYEDWAAKVPSLFPRLRPYVRQWEPWRWSTVVTNKEQWTAVVVLGLLAYLGFKGWR